MIDLNLRHILAFLPLIGLIIAMGFYPDWFFHKIEPTVNYYLSDLLHVGGIK